MTSLYHLRSASPRDTYRITKLDADYSIEAAYLVSKHECTCPAGARPTCRHRQMLPFFLAKAHIDNGWMLDWHTRQWRKPLCEDGREQPIDAQSGLSIASEVTLPADTSREEVAQAFAGLISKAPSPYPPPYGRSPGDLTPATERSQDSPPSGQMKRRKI